MKRIFLIAALAILALMAVACAQPAATPETVQPPVVQTVVVTQVTEVEGSPVVVTQVVEVTAAAEPTKEAVFNAADTSVYNAQTFGDPETLDPALNYESAGAGIIQQVYEGLVTYNREKADEYVPQLAEAMPEISEDGLTYTFTIREGIKFHEGGDLTAEDVAYSFQRGLLQGGYSSPQLLFTEPFLGVGIYDISEVVFKDDPEAGDKAGDPAAVQAADPALLQAACEQVQNAIVADGNTVTFTLANPWAPLISTMAGGWGSIQDKEWVAENGGWDGDCATWQNFYGIASENDPFTSITNGTGPYMLERWTPGEEIVLTANPDYWRNDETGPAWEGGPVGPAALSTINISNVEEWGTRFASLQAGDADSVTVPPENQSQVDPLAGEVCEYNFDTRGFDCAGSDMGSPDGALRLYRGLPSTSRTDLMFTWNINVEGGNPLVGSGALDGNGISPDFFSDVNVRRGFAYCFDYDTYIADVFNGEAVQNIGPIIPGMLGYNEDGPKYTFDLDKCAEELATAWGGTLPETGFRFQAAYNSGNTTRQVIAEIIASSLDEVSSANPTPNNYQVEVIGLPWANFLRNQRESRLPVFISGWAEDIHDPHNWVQPFLVGTYAARMGIPDELKAEFLEKINAAVVATDTAERQKLYEEITQMDYDNVMGVRLALPQGRRYEQRWVTGWYYNPSYSTTYYYAIGKQ
jgi:peptide/nickel transport system substrate-binding protein